MQQINENLLVLSPGDPYDESYENYLKIYLSGSLDLGGKGISWQEKFINGLSKLTTPHPDSPEILFFPSVHASGKSAPSPGNNTADSAFPSSGR